MSDRVQQRECYNDDEYYTSNNHDSDRHYRSALHYTHMHMHISVSTSLPTLSIVCSRFPSSSYYHYIITVIKVSGVHQ